MFKRLIDKIKHWLDKSYKREYFETLYLYRQLQTKAAKLEGEIWFREQVYGALVDESNSIDLTMNDIMSKYNLAVTLNQDLQEELIEAFEVIDGLISRLEYERVQSQKYLTDLIDGNDPWPELVAGKNFMNKKKGEVH